MRLRGRGVLRRWLPALAIALNLIAAIAPGAWAQQVNIAELIFAGRNLDAIQLAKRTFETHPRPIDNRRSSWRHACA